MTAGHLVSPAIYILRNRCLWNQVPQNTSAQSPFPAGTTYLTRALRYVAAGEETWTTIFQSQWSVVPCADRAYAAGSTRPLSCCASPRILRGMR